MGGRELSWWQIYWLSLVVAALGLALNATARPSPLEANSDVQLVAVGKVILSPWGIFDAFVHSRNVETMLVVLLCGGFLLIQALRKLFMWRPPADD